MPTVWNTSKRWFERNGKPIPQERVRQWVLDTVEKAKGRLKGIGESYLEHRNTAQWIIEARTELTSMHTALAMIAQGGREQMDSKSWGRVGQMVKSEMEYLRKFEIALDAGEVSDAQMLARLAMYGEAGYKTYSNMVKAREADAGMYARRVLDDSAKEHCDDCVSAASDEFVPASEVREIGDSQCASLCRCDVIYVDMVA